MGRRKALNEILPLFSPSPSSPIPPPPLPPALHPSSPKRSLLSPVPGGDLKQIQSEVRRCCCAWVSCAAVPKGGGTCHHRLRLNYALAFSIMSLMNEDSHIKGFFIWLQNSVISFTLLNFEREKQHFKYNNAVCSSTESDYFTCSDHQHLLSLPVSVSLPGKRTKTYLITAEKITSSTSAKPSAPRKWTSILKMKRYLHFQDTFTTE